VYIVNLDSKGRLWALLSGRNWKGRKAGSCSFHRGCFGISEILVLIVCLSCLISPSSLDGKATALLLRWNTMSLTASRVVAILCTSEAHQTDVGVRDFFKPARTTVATDFSDSRLKRERPTYAWRRTRKVFVLMTTETTGYEFRRMEIW
jgi:hypothetical protein